MPFHVYVQGAVGQLGDLACKDLRQHGCLSAVGRDSHFVKADHKTVIAVHEVEHADCKVSVFQNSCNHQRFLRSAVKREAVNLVIGAILIDCQCATPKIDGEMDDAYLKAPVIKIEGGVPRESQRKTREEVSLRILWDENNLYLYFDIKDPYITPAEHEKQWTQDYTAMYQFYLGDSIGVYLNTSGQQHTDYRSEPGVVGCAMYNGAVNHGLAGNTLYAAAGHAPIWSGKTIAPDDPNKAEKEAEVAAAKEVVNNCIYQTTIVPDAEGKATGWTCEMQIRFENFTATKDAVIGFVGQIDCDDQAKEKGGEGSGNWGTREYSLFTNSRANEQMQKECYKNTYFFDKLVLAEEPDLTPEQPEQPEQPENPGQQTTEPPTSEEPSKPNTPASTTEEKTDAKTDAPKDDKKGGCSSSIAELAFLTPVLAGFALLKKKKKSDN